MQDRALHRCNSGPGSRPSSSTSVRRAARDSSASACRPLRYSASISCPCRRSRSGYTATSAFSSPTTRRDGPVPGPRRSVLDRAQPQFLQPDRLHPRARPVGQISQRLPQPQLQCRAQARRRLGGCVPGERGSPCSTSRSKRRASSCPSSTCRRYAPDRVTRANSSPAAPRALPAAEYTSRLPCAPGGGCSPHNSWTSTSRGTDSFARSSRMTRRARSFGPPISITRPSALTLSGPRIR